VERVRPGLMRPPRTFAQRLREERLGEQERARAGLPCSAAGCGRLPTARYDAGRFCTWHRPGGSLGSRP
jgi:hypothetical protein